VLAQLQGCGRVGTRGCGARVYIAERRGPAKPRRHDPQPVLCPPRQATACHSPTLSLSCCSRSLPVCSAIAFGWCCALMRLARCCGAQCWHSEEERRARRIHRARLQLDVERAAQGTTERWPAAQVVTYHPVLVGSLVLPPRGAATSAEAGRVTAAQTLVSWIARQTPSASCHFPHAGPTTPGNPKPASGFGSSETSWFRRLGLIRFPRLQRTDGLEVVLFFLREGLEVFQRSRMISFLFLFEVTTSRLWIGGMSQFF
jgi:hypothetical protein